MNPRIPLMTVLCTLCLYSFAQKKVPLLNSGEIMQTGMKLYDDGKYKDALNEFEKIPVGDTNYVWSLYERALACSADSQYARGISYCEKALADKSEPERYPEILTQYGSLLDYADQQERSLQIFDSAIAIYPVFISLYVNKGTTLLRMKKYIEAEKVFQQAVLINPYSSSSHFKLGLCALNQGKIIPAFLGMVAYLAIEPNGRFQKNAINVLSQISKSTDEVNKLIDDRKEDPSDNYRTIEQIVLSKIALDKNYKIIIELDDAISRQMQVVFEKLSFDGSDKDFTMQYYAPLFKKIFDGKKFEYLVNYAFSNVNIPAIQNFNKQKKKEIESLTSDIEEYLNQIRATREIQFSKRSPDGSQYHFSGGKLYGKGILKDAKNEILAGPWQFYFAAGNKKSEGLFNEKGGREGTFSYYYFDGRLKAKESFLNGKQEGESIYYYDNGVVSSRGTYKNGETEGQYIIYYRSGATKSIEIYSKGKLNGLKKTFYESGGIQSEENYADGKKNGVVRSYYADGKIGSEGNYTNDLLNGSYKAWYQNGVLSAETQYNQDKLTGTLKRYYESGKPSSLENYNNGILEGEYISYHENGLVQNRYTNKKGKTTGDIQYFDEDGKLYSTLTFDDDILKAGRYYDKTGKQISVSESNKGKLEMLSFNPDGTKKTLTSYNAKGQTDATKIYYFGSGKERARETYDQGQLNGEAMAYYQNGQKRYTLSYVDEQKDGYYTSWYLHGTPQEEGWYGGDEPQGEWLNYNEQGTLVNHTWYLNGKLNGIKTFYWPTGKKQSEYLYDMNNLRGLTEYDTTGKVTSVVKLINGSGKFTSLYPNGKLYSECTYVNDNIEGAFKFYYPDGSLLAVKYYKHGLLDSTYTTYDYGGKLRLQGYYKLNEKTGTWKHYNETGTLWYSEEFEHDKLQGKSIFYFDNGKTDTEIAYKDGDRDGLYKRYDEEGALMYQLRYDDGMPASYNYLDKTGKLVSEIPLVQGSGKLKAFFQNGNISATMEYTDGVQNGAYTLYHSSGKIAISNTEVYGATEGQVNEYYSDGKPRSVHNYQHDNLHGPYKRYNAKGILTDEGNYYNGEYHGEQRFYDEAGKLKQVRTYYYGYLLAVK
ncbi:MAG: hypothetical protein QM731_02645 [Chitinophagaceae bacterium]